MKKEVEIVLTELSMDELLAQLAEECCELAHAALKLRRVYNGKNPTPVTKEEADAKVIEEFADVLLCVNMTGFDTVENFAKMGEITDNKLKRWAKRLTEKE
jgi:NTP pyrophosphatase (non-canonical NTP hydrolase)